MIQLTTTAIQLGIIIFAGLRGRYGWIRGLVPELITACGLVISYVGYSTFARLLISALNFVLAIASTIVARVQGAAPGTVRYEVSYDGLSDQWKLGLNLFSFAFMVIMSYVLGTQFAKTPGTPNKPAKSLTGMILGAVNAIIVLAALFSLWGTPNLSGANFRFTIPSVDLQLLGSRDNPLQNWLTWLILVVAAVVFTILLNIFARGLPVSSKNTNRVRVGYVLQIAVLVAIVVALVLGGTRS